MSTLHIGGVILHILWEEVLVASAKMCQCMDGVMLSSRRRVHIIKWPVWLQGLSVFKGSRRSDRPQSENVLAYS